MNIGTINGPWGEIRRASAAVGNAITASVNTAAAAYCAFPPGSAYAYLEGRNYSTAVVIGYALNPWLRIIKTTDSLATAANATDYSEAAQNNIKSTAGVVLSSFATTHALWIGAELPFRGIFCDVNATNSNAATVAAAYWSQTGPTMASLSITDNTIVTGASFMTDASMTWTVPTDWTATTLRTAGGAVVGVPRSGDVLYWIKLTVNAALDASTTLDQLLAMNRSTNYASLTSGKPGEWVALATGDGRVGCIEAATDAGTGNLIINVATANGGKFM